MDDARWKPTRCEAKIGPITGLGWYQATGLAQFLFGRTLRLLQAGETFGPIGLFPCGNFVHKGGIICGYGRVSTDGQTVAAQKETLTAAGTGKGVSRGGERSED